MSHNQYHREMAMALVAHPSIFKLDVDCFEELFDWLSLKDLHAFGQTCKRMQQVAGYFFRLTHPEAFVHFWGDKLLCNGVEISGFGDFIENIMFSDTDLPLVADSYEFKSLKKIHFEGIRFDGDNVACIKKFLGKVEIIEISWCIFIVDFYNEFLKYCTNLKRLVRHENAHLEYNWLLQNYPGLEQLVLDPAEYTQIDELTTFFERNPSVRYFAANPELLWANRHSFTASNVKLDTLSIYLNENVTDEFRGMMNEFREREAYQRLNLNVEDDSQNALLQFASADVVEKLIFSTLPMNVASLPFVNLKELYSQYIPDDLDMETVVNAFVNIEHIWFEEANATQIVAFICRSRKLTTIAINDIKLDMEGDVLQLASWNKERKKLAGARKVTIHVAEEVYLETKEATQNKNYQLIEIKRIDSFCWTEDFQF